MFNLFKSQLSDTPSFIKLRIIYIPIMAPNIKGTIIANNVPASKETIVLNLIVEFYK